MASTPYALTPNDWTDCGAADDCALQLVTDGVIVFTTATAKPASASIDGIVLPSGDTRMATIYRAGKKLFARVKPGSGPNLVSIVVER